jgi:probable H4MPT-linked C1 transfer pathway protein
LKRVVADILAEAKLIPGSHAITMTGELADIFSNRDEGVRQLTETMVQCLGVDDISIYAGSHGFVAPAANSNVLPEIASANWHASAHWLAGNVHDALLMDVGSTTSDLVVLYDSKPASRGYSDAARMQFDELIYTGAIRTPVMAVVQRVPFDGAWQGVAAEHFATMADVYRLTAELSEACDMSDTADGAAKSVKASARRLARMVGRDLADATMEQWRALALAIRSRHLRILQDGVERALSRGLLDARAPLVGAGAGSFLAQAVARQMDREYRDAAEWVLALPDVKDWAMVCLPAYAVGHLALRAKQCRS